MNGGNKDGDASAHYELPKIVPVPSSVKNNEYGVFYEATYPTLLNGTNAPQGPPSWFKKEKEVDVLICGGASSCLCGGFTRKIYHGMLILRIFSRPVRSPGRCLHASPGLLLPHYR